MGTECEGRWVQDELYRRQSNGKITKLNYFQANLSTWRHNAHPEIAKYLCYQLSFFCRKHLLALSLCYDSDINDIIMQ